MERKLFSKNDLLQAVEPELRPLAASQLSVVELARGNVLYTLGAPVDRVYFPVRGLIGILAETLDGEGMDSAVVGREGAIGVFEACGSRQFFAEAVVQVAGEAATMSAADYRDLFGASAQIRNAVHRYVEQLMSETRQSVVCSALHDLEGRLARIILDSLDRSGTDDVLSLTQETLARMLGSQRSTIAALLSRLQRAGTLRTRRGEIELEDRAALERLACTCRTTMRDARRAIWASSSAACESHLVAAE